MAQNGGETNMAAKTCFILFALFYSGHCNPLGQTTVCESQSMPNMLSPATTTVCETTPNLPYYPFLNNLAVPLPMPMPMPMPMPIPFPPMPIPYPPLPIIQPNPIGPIGPIGQTTVCESQPSFGPVIDPSLGGLGGYPFLPRPMPGMGQTTVCESQPNIGMYPCRPMPLGSATLCESTPNLLGYPFGYPLRPLSPLVY